MNDEPTLEAITEAHSVFVGSTGSGKTSSAKACVEHVVLQHGARVCVLDPIKSDWWGIAYSPSLSERKDGWRILGGPRGDVPLTHTAGEAVGMLVANGQLPRVVLDMADFPPGGVSRFFCDFSNALMRHNSGVLHLVLEEAHEFIPKERSGVGNENMAVYYGKKLATAGRSKGIRLMSCTQRTQKLHNDIFSSAAATVAMYLETPGDRKPVIDHIKDRVEDPAIVAHVRDTLGKLPTGTGLLVGRPWPVPSPFHFPRIDSYDNSKTPTRADKERQLSLPPLRDRELKALLHSAVLEAEANDPKALRDRVAELEKMLAGKAPTLGDIHMAASSAKQGARILELEEQLREARDATQSAFDNGKRVGRQEIRTLVSAALEKQFGDEPASQRPESELLRTFATPVPPAPRPGTRPQSAPRKEPEGDLPERIGRAIFWYRHHGIERPTTAQACAIAGVKAEGGYTRRKIGALRTAGLIDAGGDGRLGLTDLGVHKFRYGIEPIDVAERWRSILDAGIQQEIFDELLGNGALTREQLGKRLGKDVEGGYIRRAIGRMKTLEVIEYPEQGKISLSRHVVQPEPR